MIKTEAYLVDGYMVVLDCTWLADILHDCRKRQVEMGTFEGYVNENNTPIGTIKTERGAVLKVDEDYNAELVSA